MSILKQNKIVMHFFFLELVVLKEAESDLHNSFFGLCGKKVPLGMSALLLIVVTSVPCHWVYFELHTQQRAYI